MTLHFPCQFTFDHISKMADAEDAFSWDDSQAEEDYSFIDRIEEYSEAYWSSNALGEYLAKIGYLVKGKLVFVRNEQALHTAHALFNQIYAEYDEPDCPTVDVPLLNADGSGEYTTSSTPTWHMFDLGGDDYVDYCGTQPSCLTSLLITHLNKGA